MTVPAKIKHLSVNKIPDFIYLCSIMTYNNHLYCSNKIFINTVEFNGLSSVAYGNGILHSERKILAKQ